MKPATIERITWGAIILPAGTAAAATPNPRTIGALAGILVARWVGSAIVSGAAAIILGEGQSCRTPHNDGRGTG